MHVVLGDIPSLQSLEEEIEFLAISRSHGGAQPPRSCEEEAAVDHLEGRPLLLCKHPPQRRRGQRGSSFVELVVFVLRVFIGSHHRRLLFWSEVTPIDLGEHYPEERKTRDE